MAQRFNAKIYDSSRWKKVRKLAMERTVRTLDGRLCPPFMCERCFERGKLVPAELVHHIKHLTPQNVNDPMICYGLDNLMRVCRDCHAEIHYPSDYTPRVSFDSEGNVVKLG